MNRLFKSLKFLATSLSTETSDLDGAHRTEDSHSLLRLDILSLWKAVLAIALSKSTLDLFIRLLAVL